MNSGPSAGKFPPGLASTTGRNARFRQLIESGEFIIAPGAFDCISARLVEQAAFPAVYMTGSGVSMSRLGAPDVGLISATEMADQVARIADVTSIPIVADADTGYGGPLNVIRTVRDYERAGVSAIQIEDQAWPKKCGHEPGRHLVDLEEMTGRIKAAADARGDPDFMIIARTDARTSLGIESAIERALLCREAGADILFVESPESEAEMALINQQLPVPTLANMVEGGRTPVLPSDRLAELGYSIAIFPNSLTRLLGHVGREMLASLKSDGTTAAWHNRMLDHRGLWDLFDYDDWLATEARYNGKEQDHS
jgi:2-methylisocitrate lyase-like PEP mutase family enzyme